jgi:hypothetical protein
MAKSKLVPMMISLPKEFRDKLRTMAAEQNFVNPDQVTSSGTNLERWRLNRIL